MSDNIVAQVAAGNSPQPAAANAAPTNFDEIREDAEGSVEIADPSAPAEPTAQEAKAIQDLKKKLKLKVDGQDIEEELDFNDEDALKRHLQKSKSFDKRSKEFADYRSQVDQLMQMLQNDPEALLERMGHNVDQLSEKRLARKIEEMKKSPEQIEQEKMRKELEDLRQEKKKIEEQKQKAELEKMRNEQAQQIETDIHGALDSAKSILPKNNPLVLQRVAQTMLMAMQNGYPNVTAKDVIPLVEKQWQQELNEFFSVVPEEIIERLVKKDNLDRYRKKIVSNRPKAQTATAKQIVKDSGKIQETPKETNKPSYRKFFSNYED